MFSGILNNMKRSISTHNEKVIRMESNDSKGFFEYSPLEPGFGITIGNSLRRVLISSLEGFAITSLKIVGITHEFTVVPGIIEDVTEIVLNLKKIRLKKRFNYHIKNETVNVTLKNENKPYQFTAGDLGTFIVGFQVLNKNLVLFNKYPYSEIRMTLTIEKGRGYVAAEYNKIKEAPIGTIFIDSIYTPIINVKYHVVNSNVKKKNEYEKLYMEIQTDGSIHPKDALKAASKILLKHFIFLIDDSFIINKNKKMNKINKFYSYSESYNEPYYSDEYDNTEDETIEHEILRKKKLLSTNISELGLSIKAKKCLIYANIKKLWQLVIKSEIELKKIINLGRQTLYEIKKFLKKRNLYLNMDLSKYV